MTLRVGLVGARRANQGLGPFVARDLRAAGARVVAFVVSRPASIAPATRQLSELAGVAAAGYVDLGELLAREEIDALAICSPHEAHREALEAALRAGLHVLCEKPLLWGVPDPGQRATELVGGFARRGLVIFENCQWPYALPAFRELHPAGADEPPRRFRMELQPAGRGARMLADSLPHALSLLQRLAPGPAPRLGEIRFAGGGSELAVRFRYCAAEAEVETCVELRPTSSHPREARLEIDGRRARRRVSQRDYGLSFTDGPRSVALRDPLTLLVRDFARAAEAGSDPDGARRRREIVERARLLAEIVSAFERSAP